MFINPAYAEVTNAVVETPSTTGAVIQLVLICAIFYFLLIRPQKKSNDRT